MAVVYKRRPVTGVRNVSVFFLKAYFMSLRVVSTVNETFKFCLPLVVENVVSIKFKSIRTSANAPCIMKTLY